jgi:hypothetical protein
MPEPQTTPPVPTPSADSAAALLAVVDAYLEELRQGQAPDRAAVLAAHPELAPRLESCLAALDFIHRAEHTDPAVPPTLGDFLIVREIGRGAMGVVYEAEQLSLKRRVALKVLRFGASPDAEAMARFRREAETVAGLHHTNIVPLFAVGCEAGVHFFAMQLIAGCSLADVLNEANTTGRALDATRVAGWGVQAAEALAHAHARGVVHRDVKPSNLLLDKEGIVWLTDFGLARRRDEATLTVAGAQLGTPRYMSPEQAAAVQTPVDQRSDVYSLGATLYELATGKPVFDAPTTGQLFEQIAQAEPVPPRRHRKELPRDLETVLLRCLAKDPAQRYPTARDLADDLRRVASGDPIKARRPGLLLRLRRWAGRRRPQAKMVGVAAVAMVATLVLGVVGLSWWQADREARKGSVTLKFEGESGRGEILGAGGKPAVPPFTLPTQTPIELPGGWYSLRVIQPGRLSEEYELFIEQGQQRTFTVGSKDRQLWEPMPIKGTVVGDFGLLHITSEPGPTRVTVQLPGGESGRGEILGEDGKLVVPSFALPALKPIELPAGQYRLRVTEPERLRKEYSFTTEPGMQEGFLVDSSQGKQLRQWTRHSPPAAVIITRLSSPAKESPKWEKWSENPFVPTKLWELKLEWKDPILPRLNDDEWSEFCRALRSFVWEPDTRIQSAPERQLLQPAPDLDGDGVGDLVFAFDRFLLAISGKEGKLLWCRELHSNVFRTETRMVCWEESQEGIRKLRQGELTLWFLTKTEQLSLLALSVVQAIPGVTVPFPPSIYTETRGELAGSPLVVADIDGDGHPDLVLTHGAFFFQFCGVANPCVEAVSGRTGKTLWRHEPPSLAQRLVLFEHCKHKEEIRKGEFHHLGSPTRLHDFASLAERRTDKGRTLLVGLYDTVERLDLLTGHTVAPSTQLRSWGHGEYSGSHVGVWSADGKIAFVQRFDPWVNNVDEGGILRPDWYAIDTTSGKHLGSEQGAMVLADLDGDGVPEIITADESVIDGKTGEKLGWMAGFKEGNFGAVLAGPDFDGDGHRDVFTTTVVDGERYGHPRGVKVLLAGLRSGKDGRLLWLTAEPIPGSGEFQMHFREKEWRQRTDFAGAVFYWRSAPGTAGYFVVNMKDDGFPAEKIAFLFAVDTGRLAHVWAGVTVEGVADLDGDGLLDLYGRKGDQLVTVRATAPELWRRPGRWRWQWLDPARERHATPSPAYLTGPVPHTDLDGDGVPDVLLFTPGTHNNYYWKCEAYSGRDGRVLWVQSRELLKISLYHPSWIECLDLEGEKRPVVVVWGAYDEKSNRSECALLDGRTGKLRLKKEFPGVPLSGLLYRQPEGLLALVYRESPMEGDGFLVAVNADGNVVARVPFPARVGKDEFLPPEGFEFRRVVNDRWEESKEKRFWRFGGWGDLEDIRLGRLGKEERFNWIPTGVGWRVDPSDSALLQLYDIGDNRLTVLRKGIPSNPACEVPVSSYPEEVVLKRALPWLELARKNAVAGVGNVAGYLALPAVLAAVGRRKTALFLLALFILLPAFAATLGLWLVLAILVAALPWKAGPKGHERPLDFTGTVWGKSTLGLLLLPAAFLTNVVLGVPALNGAMKATVWTYAVVLVPLIVLALVGWKKTALGLLVPCLLLLLYLNWPPLGAISDHKSYLLDFSLLEPRFQDGQNARYFVGGTLLPYEAWDWSGWYWLWPWQMGAWQGRDTWHPLVLALVLVGGSEFVPWLVRWWIRNAYEGVL